MALNTVLVSLLAVSLGSVVLSFTFASVYATSHASANPAVILAMVILASLGLAVVGRLLVGVSLTIGHTHVPLGSGSARMLLAGLASFNLLAAALGLNMAGDNPLSHSAASLAADVASLSLAPPVLGFVIGLGLGRVVWRRHQGVSSS
jgi:hypothetical protein